jgi:hypothetical protein
MHRVGLGAVALAVVSTVGQGSAQTTQTVFSHKHWQVEIVQFDDGSYACEAKVSTGDESFSMWAFQDGTVRLQFYSVDWDFSGGGSADLELQIDRRKEWNLTNAELYQNSVLFDIPGTNDALRFVNEVAQGNRLFLRDDAGQGVRDYSLAGSKASITALVDCSDVITGG